MNCLTFPVQPFELLLELVDEVADGGADGSQVEVSVDADRRPISGLRWGRQRRQVLSGTRKSKVMQGEVKLNCNHTSKSLDKLETISTIQHCLVNLKDLMEYESMQIYLYKSKSSNVGKHTLTEKDQSVQDFTQISTFTSED